MFGSVLTNIRDVVKYRNAFPALADAEKAQGRRLVPFSRIRYERETGVAGHVPLFCPVSLPGLFRMPPMVEVRPEKDGLPISGTRWRQQRRHCPVQAVLPFKKAVQPQGCERIRLRRVLSRFPKRMRYWTDISDGGDTSGNGPVHAACLAIGQNVKSGKNASR